MVGTCQVLREVMWDECGKSHRLIEACSGFVSLGEEPGIPCRIAAGRPTPAADENREVGGLAGMPEFSR